jgi:hypothetical protein
MKNEGKAAGDGRRIVAWRHIKTVRRHVHLWRTIAAGDGARLAAVSSTGGRWLYRGDDVDVARGAWRQHDAALRLAWLQNGARNAASNDHKTIWATA